MIDLVDHMLARERTNRLADLRDAVDVLAKYSHAKRPSFGPPRAPRITQDSGPKIEPELRQVDPGAPTENVSSKERVSIPQELLDSQRRAPSDTLVAGSTPRPSSSPRSRQDTAEAHVTATRNSVGPARPTMLAVGVIGGLLLLGAIGLGVRSLTTSHSATPAAPSASTSPLSVPTVQPVPAVPSVVPSTTAEPAPTVTASAKPTASAEPTTKPTAAWVKPVKSAVSASAAITAPPAPTPAPPPTTTSTGGLVTKPPF